MMAPIETTDWHVHYYRDGCADAEMKVESIIAAAVDKGLEALGLLGHFRNRLVICDLAYWTRPNPRFFDLLRRDVSAAESRVTKGGFLNVFVGAEADINTLEGDLSISPEQAADLDYVMVGAHWPPTLPPHLDYIDLKEPSQLVEAYCSYNRISAREFSVERLIGDIFRSMIHSVERHAFIDVLAHPAGFATRLGPFCLEMDAAGWFERMAAALSANGVACELNASAINEYSPEVLDGFVKPFFQTCADAGVLFAVGSDAHRIGEIGDVRPALRVKEQLGIPDDLFVTSPEMLPRKSA